MTNQPYNTNRANLARSNSCAYNGQEHTSLIGLSPAMKRLRRELRAAAMDAAIVFDVSTASVIARVLRRARVFVLADMTRAQLTVAVRYIAMAADTGEWPDSKNHAVRQAMRDVKAILRRFPSLVDELRA